MKNSYEPYWPENVIFWGSGATAPLGMQTTFKIGETLFCLSKDHEMSLDERLNRVFPSVNDAIKKQFDALLALLSNREDSERQKAAELLGFSEARVSEICNLYDWDTLKLVIKRCPQENGQLQLQDVYNLLDMHIQSGNGFYGMDQTFIRPEKLIMARRTLDMLVITFHKIGYQQLLVDPEKKKVYRQYYEFAKVLAEFMIEEGLMKEKQFRYNDRNFYLFSYAVVSMNWDPLLLWLIFNAHREMNESEMKPYIGIPPQPMKLFNDFAHFMAVRKIEADTPGPWFPMNETAVQRLNDPDHNSRRVRIGKFYFPHGSHGFRQCPNCGKLTFYLGNQWKVDSDDLFPPLLLPSLSPRKPRSVEEQRALEEGKYDAVQCTHCGSITELHHTSIVMQTNFKNGYPPFIEEIQRDMKVAIEKAEHLIFAGYSLPSDDFIYRSIFTAKRNIKERGTKCSIIGYLGEEGKDEWLEGDALEEFMKQHPDTSFTNTCQRIIDIFGKENVRGYSAGFPQVFIENGRVNKGKVKEMLWWPSES
ncbi:hypothetical protein [Bacillus smithii]|uniref:hypothetical protein n=1 Tax=Bacillus smithii TaxID=1479 RepID=UPI003D196D70